MDERRRHHRRRPPTFDKSSIYKPICSSIFNFFLIVGLVFTMCVIFEYYCEKCDTKYNLNDLSKNIEDIALNLASLERNYQDLEEQISNFSKELPKIEGQILTLETLASTIDKNHYYSKVWDSRSHLC